jgi:hypothetical protein
VIDNPIPLVRKEMVARLDIYFHRGDFGTGRENQKTYRSLLGMIFSGGFQPALVVERQ